MNESDLHKETRRWLHFAWEDLTEAQAMLERGEFIPRHACWLAQQSAEKALKAILVLVEIEFPKKHDLDALRNMIPEGWQVKLDHPDLAELSEWAVEARYPGNWPEAVTSDAHSAVKQAQAVWESVRFDLDRRGLTVDV